jgi:hypothetical protein
MVMARDPTFSSFLIVVCCLWAVCALLVWFVQLHGLTFFDSALRFRSRREQLQQVLYVGCRCAVCSCNLLA